MTEEDCKRTAEYSTYLIDRTEHIAGQLSELMKLHGFYRFGFIMVCTPDLIHLDKGAVDTALERLLASKEGPLCWPVIYREVKRVCAERGLPDPQWRVTMPREPAAASTSPEATLLAWPSASDHIH